MTESLRLLLYPLGYLAQLLFGLRFIVQWLQSEKQKKSVVPKSFWIVSCSANLLLALHAYIQLQFPLLFLQMVAALISLRNLDLLGKRRYSFKQALFFSITLLSLVTLLFFWQEGTWMRAPGKQTHALSTTIHLIGSAGLFLFASRFWIQWWQAERAQKSDLTHAFWWMSVVGASLSLFYFFHLRDPVNVLGYSLGIIPYIRNLQLLKKRRFAFAPQNTIFILAAEKSGDELGGDLLSKLKQQMPDTRFIGVGGDAMAKEGIELFLRSDQFEVMGLTALFPAAGRLFKNFHKIKRFIAQEKPKMVILIDYAEFNMLLARSLRKGGYQGKLVQYVIPSVWAWRKGRIHTLDKYYDLLLSILPFEQEYFVNKKVKVSFVGHPLAHLSDFFAPDANWKRKIGFPETTTPLCALFPGSRGHEIEDNLPYQLEAIKELTKTQPLSIAISVASKKLQKRIEELANTSGITYSLVPQQYRYELMKEASFSLSTCGTVILELALFRTPTVVLYKISYLNYLVGYYLFRIRLPYFSLPNIMMKKALFPELVDKKIKLSQINSLLDDVMKRKQTIREECKQIQALLSREKALSAVDEILTLLQENK